MLGSGATYVLSAADRTHVVTCTITSERIGYIDATSSTDSVPVAPPAKVTGLKPRILGKTYEGSKVTADAGEIAPSSAVLTY